MPNNTEDLFDEKAVIKRILDGRKNDYALLIRAHQQQVYAMIMRTTGNPDTAQELTQESFIRAYKSLKTFRGQAAFSTWVTRIAINCTNSWYQSKSCQQQRQKVALDEIAEPLDSGTAIDPFNEENIIRLQQGLAAMDEKYRSVMMLCSLEGKSYQQAADILDLPYGTVCSRMNAAIKFLRKFFREDV
ncbi:MAG: sigma-70 family RNA polymerase sigma factor [bacterium]|nr:sigma-70 family RNA polymerase sigma factor [bacterium]